MKLRFLWVVFVLAWATTVQAQTTGPIRVHTEGIKVSPLGGVIANGTLMADSLTIAVGANWAVIYSCFGSPVLEGTPLVEVGGKGVYMFERYNLSGVIQEIQFGHDVNNQGGIKSIPGPLPGGDPLYRDTAPQAPTEQVPGALTAQPILFGHGAFQQGGPQSIPPMTLLPGEGLRIRTAAALGLKGALSCYIQMYTFQ